MYLEGIRLDNFRCHSTFECGLDKTTYIEGSNGSGKTSVAEAVFLLLTLKSFKEQSVKNIRRFDTEFLRVEGSCVSGDSSERLIYFHDDNRTIKQGGTCVLDIPTYLTEHPVVCFSPDSSTILSKDQRLRRAYIDRAAFYSDRAHIYDLRRYNRLLAQKSAAYQKQRIDFDYIETVDDALVPLAGVISGRRRAVADMINSRLERLYTDLGWEMEFFSLIYETNTDKLDTLEREREGKRPVYGIQRDRFYSGNRERKYDKFNSFGQRKTFELLVLFSILIDVEEILKTGIITLLDDFEAGLDEHRSALFKEIFSGERQIIITGVKNRIFADTYTVSL